MASHDSHDPHHHNHLPSELARHAADLEHALDKARRDLTDFAHIAAHDLKEPFRTINFQASFILDDHRSTLPPDAITKLEGIQKAAVRGGKLVDEMVRYARSGEVRPADSPVELGALVYEAASTIPVLKSKEAELTIAGNLPILTVDPAALSSAFANLLSNAVRYNRSTPKKVRVYARDPVAIDPDSPALLRNPLPPEGTPAKDIPVVQVCVADNGVGIPPGQRPTVFRIFKRLHREEEFGPGGGVGLAIVKKIIEAHRGEVTIEDNPEGQGTVFVLTLPKR
jgi:signal transduction histidine kinase